MLISNQSNSSIFERQLVRDQVSFQTSTVSIFGVETLTFIRDHPLSQTSIALPNTRGNYSKQPLMTDHILSVFQGVSHKRDCCTAIVVKYISAHLQKKVTIDL